MREINLDQLFAEFEATAAPTFRPPGVSDVQHRVRRRRGWRHLLAGWVALLLAGPVGAYVLTGADGEPLPPNPMPSPSTALVPDGNLIDRHVGAPGATTAHVQPRFVDARHGWSYSDTCFGQDLIEDCERSLIRTTDGGATWRGITVPPSVAEPESFDYLELLPLDAQRLVMRDGNRYFLTTDGGATFTEHPGEGPPTAALFFVATSGGFVIHCPGLNGLEPPACPRQQLTRIGGGGGVNQPPVVLASNYRLAEGGDGRLWVGVKEEKKLTVAVSEDGAKTWRKLPPVTGAASLLVSPDGADVWLVDSQSEDAVPNPTRTWRLVGDTWREGARLPGDTYSVEAGDGGLLWLTRTKGGGGYFVDGRYTPVPELDGLWSDPKDVPYFRTLPDGTIELSSPPAIYLGVGSGTDRTWIRFRTQ
ncbi:sialidase family protein [Micromonospora sp. NPDC049891]|uniref:sialidase family protein n=1 Tax=Micromonospora sp. NPDC049891 TaxID=3155655 RepID=UPI0033D81E64